MEPDVTAIVVTYRSRDHLPGCLAALPAAAAGRSVEVVVVDNASDDGTPELIRQRFTDARVLVNPGNHGFAAAANRGAREARGRTLLLLNPDAVMAPGSLGRLCATLDADPRVGLAGPGLVNPDGTPQPSAWPEPGLATLAFEALMLYNVSPRSPLHAVWSPTDRDVPCLSGACLLVRRKCFDDLGGLDEGFFLYHEDFDFCLRARAAGWRVRLVPEAVATHAVGGSAFEDRRAFFRRFHATRKRLIRKHHRGARGALMEAVHQAGLALHAAVHAVRGLAPGGRAWREQAAHEAAALRGLWFDPPSTGC